MIYSRIFAICVGLWFTTAVFAFDCYFTFVKDSCWSPYHVTIKVNDVDKNTILETIHVHAGKQWVRKKVNCEPQQKLLYTAQFTPVFWEREKDKVYSALRYWILPERIKEGDQGWHIPVCFPKDFSGVPLPPDAKGNCECDFQSLPPIDLGTASN